MEKEANSMSSAKKTMSITLLASTKPPAASTGSGMAWITNRLTTNTDTSDGSEKTSAVRRETSFLRA